MFQTLLDFVFPRTSVGGSSGVWITEDELTLMTGRPLWFSKDYLADRGLTSLDGLAAAAAYKSTPYLQKAIHTFKYKRIKQVGESLSQVFISAIALLPQHIDATIVPVPLHWSRQFWRGFNQAELMAKAAHTSLHFPINHLLKRIRSTGHQAHRKRSERFSSLTNAFAITSDHVPSIVILIDDVCTTGATLDACAKVLKQAGVSEVYALVLAYDS